MSKNSLKKINSIMNFGCFKNFNASSDLNEFQKYNLIWGLNGTGKTTLSRFFECLNNGDISPDYDNSEYVNQVEFIFQNEEEQTLKKHKTFKENPFIGKIKIFNSDFVRLNLSLDNTNVSTHTITYNIGEISKDLKQKMYDLETKLNSFYLDSDITKKLNIDFQIENSKKALEESYTTIASAIRDALGIDNSQSYNRNAFLNNYETICATGKPNVSELEKNNAVKKYKQPSRNAINIKLKLIIDEDELKNIQELLNTEIKRKTEISDELVNWLEQGLNLKNSDNCPFCGTNIAQDWELRHKQILELIKKDDSYIKFESDLASWYNTIMARKQNINLEPFNNLRSSDFINEMDDTKLNSYKNICRTYLSSINSIADELKQKNINKDTIYDISNYEININNYSDMISTFNKCIEDNNKSVLTIEEDKRTAKETVIKYYVAKNYDSINEQNKHIQELENNKIAIYEEVENIKKELKELKLQLSNQSLPIKEIEKYTNIIFGYEKFNLELNKETDSYVIKRDGNKIAQNLSEGEKTVISFAYFLATLKSENFNLSEAIVIIDDPVSSLDQQYLFNLLNLLMEIFSAPKSFSQIFILTHNFYFFKKINAILQNKEKAANSNVKDTEETKNEEKITLFQIFQICKDESSQIINANKYLRNFQSEYSFLIKYLKDVMKKDDEEISCIPIGNSIRKILEIFLAFRCPKQKTIFSQYERVTKDWDDVEKGQYKYLQDIANATSHAEGCIDLDVSEDFKIFVGKKEIKQLFDFIKRVDLDHYEQLPN